LDELDLSGLTVDNFSQRLDELTERLQRELGYPFGPARKVVNLYMRDLLYADLTRSAYTLEGCQHLMECPLDSLTMKGIKNAANLTIKVPQVSKLQRSESDHFQEVGKKIADGRNTCAVHLDLIYWSDNH
jgi:hypothetical protein